MMLLASEWLGESSSQALVCMRMRLCIITCAAMTKHANDHVAHCFLCFYACHKIFEYYPVAKMYQEKGQDAGGKEMSALLEDGRDALTSRPVACEESRLTSAHGTEYGMASISQYYECLSPSSSFFYCPTSRDASAAYSTDNYNCTPSLPINGTQNYTMAMGQLPNFSTLARVNNGITMEMENEYANCCGSESMQTSGNIELPCVGGVNFVMPFHQPPIQCAAPPPCQPSSKGTNIQQAHD